MSRKFFDRIFTAVVAEKSTCKAGLTRDSIMNAGCKRLQNEVSAVQQTTDGVDADVTDEYCQLRWLTAREALNAFVRQS